MYTLTPLVPFLLALPSALAWGNTGYYEKIYGVNLGSWLLVEPWMLPREWQAMGGEDCNPFLTLNIFSGSALAQAYPDTVDDMMAHHWDTWFNQTDVEKLVELGLNTVRIPLGYWIIEDLVNRTSEFYPRGGLKALRRGLNDLKNAGIQAILDHHALPGVAAIEQMFAGRCTNVSEFYTAPNYERALTWTAVMTALSHIDPVFGGVFSIQAVNEPIMNATQTPKFGEFQKNFALTIRLVESLLGIAPFPRPIKAEDYLQTPLGFAAGLNLNNSVFPPTPWYPPYPPSTSSYRKRHFPSNATIGNSLEWSPVDIFTAFRQIITARDIRKQFPKTVLNAVGDGVSILLGILFDIVKQEEEDYSYKLPRLGEGKVNRFPLVTNFMDINWQNSGPANPVDAAIGPIGFDNHLYYNFGGVADPNAEAYLTHLCNLDRIQKDAALGNTPLWFGEWSLATNFAANESFIRDWADAQKLQYGRDAGWIFWNFKIENSTQAGDIPRAWSYLEAYRRGYFTKDPAEYHNPYVCEPWINRTVATLSVQQ
uniref:Putative glycoside hydrolase family 5 protein n=1 Tax=Moniliophthora roreri TaxID=221103 RepID=A0A0W0G5E0_MONRR